jgi:VIT1/CCC1 family predicted Fe2+/Mn2+ transporter
MLTPSIDVALRISVLATAVALICFGAVKGHFTGVNKLKSAAQTLLVGGLAAGAAYWLAHLFG